MVKRHETDTKEDAIKATFRHFMQSATPVSILFTFLSYKSAAKDYATFNKNEKARLYSSGEIVR